jgi:hypothetical protein
VKHQALAVAGLLLCGCPKKEAPPEFELDDRLLQKMKAEQERLSKVQRPAVEPDPLAEVIARPSRPENLGIPSGVEAELGLVSLSLIEVQQSQTVRASRVSLSTADQFLKVSLDAVSKKDLDLDLSRATLVFEEQSVAIARDAQRAGQGSELVTRLEKRQETRLVLFFEAPAEMIRKGLKIILTTPESRVELQLQ